MTRLTLTFSRIFLRIGVVTIISSGMYYLASPIAQPFAYWYVKNITEYYSLTPVVKFRDLAGYQFINWLIAIANWIIALWAGCASVGALFDLKSTLQKRVFVVILIITLCFLFMFLFQVGYFSLLRYV